MNWLPPIQTGMNTPMPISVSGSSTIPQGPSTLVIRPVPRLRSSVPGNFLHPFVFFQLSSP